MLKFKLNLQFFSEPPGGDPQDPPPQDPPTPKTFTEEEVQKMLQSEADKRVSQALQTAKQKWEDEYKQKLEQEKSEAARLAKMTEEERAKAEFEKQKSEFEKQKAAFEDERLLNQTITELANKKLPVVFAPHLKGKTAEETLANINSFSDTWAQALENEVNERLKGNAPKVSTKTPDAAYNPWDRQTLNLTKQAEILKTNPELAKQLMAQSKK